MMKEMVIKRDNGNQVMLTDEVYEKFWRMVTLLGDNTGGNLWRNTFYLLVHLSNCLEIRIPCVIKRNYNFFSEDETNLLEKLYSEIKALNDAYINNDDLCDISVVNRIMNEFMSLYDTIIYFFEFRLYAHKREVLLVELQKCLNEADYMEYRMKLISAGSDLKMLQDVVLECEKIILEDWGKKLTDPNEYQEGAEYAFICHAGVPKNSGLVSASLLTNKVFATYEDANVLFILDYHSMFNTEPSDCGINNYCSDPILAKPDHLFSILTKDTLEEGTLEIQESGWEENYNEVNLYEFIPIGILVLLEDEHDSILYNIGQEMKNEYPDLSLVYINKSLYKPRGI